MKKLETDKPYKIGDFVIAIDSEEPATLRIQTLDGNVSIKPMASNSVRITNDSDIKKKKSELYE